MIILIIKLEYRIQVIDSSVIHHSLAAAQPVTEQKVKSQIIIFL